MTLFKYSSDVLDIFDIDLNYKTVFVEQVGFFAFSTPPAFYKTLVSPNGKIFLNVMDPNSCFLKAKIGKKSLPLKQTLEMNVPLEMEVEDIQEMVDLQQMLN